MHTGMPMRRVVRVLSASAVLSALVVGCGSVEPLQFAKGDPTKADAADETPYPEGGITDPDANPPEADPDAAPPGIKCPPGKDGKSNVCVRVLRGSEGPSVTADAKSAYGVDGKGAVLIGLAAVKPSGRDSSFITSTWLPTESSSAGKLAATELPKVVELTVAPGTYWAYAVFRDQEPYIRPGPAIGDYIPRLVELPQVTVVADMGASVDVLVHPVRAVDLEIKLTTAASGSGSGPVGAWLINDGKIAGEGRVPCADLSGGRTEVVRVFTTYTGTFDVGAALFDFTAPTDDASGSMPALPPGTIHNDFTAALGAVKIAEGDWLVPTRKRIDLDRAVPTGSVKPTDSFPSCASYAFAPPM
jgi:hypothetical protein